MPSVFPLTSYVVAGLMVTALSACGQVATPTPGAPGAMPSSDARKGSWMLPEARNENLLYVSDQDGGIYVFSYPKGRQVGTLTGFATPAGLCSDSAGDVFVVDTNASSVVEFAHAGTEPIQTLHDFGYYPWGCSVDRSTGNLAVTNINEVPSGPGNIAIYASARGMPATLGDPNLVYPYFCGYDGSGDLFFSGLAASPPQERIWELPRSSGSFTILPIKQSFKQEAGVQWDGRYLAVGHASVVDRFVVNASHATLVGATPLRDAKLVLQFWIAGKNVVGPDFQKGSVGSWSYPQGGEPNLWIRGLPIHLFGSTVSRAR
jgi:NHL repeat